MALIGASGLCYHTLLAQREMKSIQIHPRGWLIVCLFKYASANIAQSRIDRPTTTNATYKLVTAPAERIKSGMISYVNIP